MVWGLQNELAARVRVYDANRNLLPTTVIVNDGFSYVVEWNDAIPQQTYYLEVVPAQPGQSRNVGNYFLGADFGPHGAALNDVADGLLTSSRPQMVDTLIVNSRSELMHFVLAAVAANPGASTAVEMSIVNLTGHVVFTLEADNTVPTSGNVSLAPGTYTVVFSAMTGTGGFPVVYHLLAETLSDPQGPETSDPTGDPGGSSGTDPNGPPDWNGGSSTGVPSQDPSSGSYGSNGTAQGANASSITLYNPGDQTDFAGDGVNWSVSAADSDPNAPLSYSATGLPPGLSMDHSSGTFSGSIPNDAGNGAPYVVTINVSDSNGSTATQTFNWTVNPPVVNIYSGGDQTNLAGDTVGVIESGYNSDSFPLTFSATGLPPGVHIDPYSGYLYGTVANNAAQAASYVVTITATDTSSGVSASATLKWTVSPPIVNLYSPGNQMSQTGDGINLGLSWSNTDNYAVTFSISGLPAGLTIDPGSGLISGTIATNAASDAPYVVTITALDPSSGVSSTVTINWTVC